ncbi:MAG: glycosyltransferase [Clostridia bacterium]|nr:glycosyltransferase [Clostridia bacterium]
MESPRAKISLIIPCYNIEEALITRALDSVAAQDFSDYEVIVVDDGSRSELHEVLERVVPKYEKTTLITIPNGGVSNARNVGVSRASGEYVAFLDGDDALTKHFFSESYKAAAETGAEFVIGCVVIAKKLNSFDPAIPDEGVRSTVYEGDEVESLREYLTTWRKEMRFTSCENGEKRVLYINRGPVARLLKRSIADRIGFPVGIKVGEDIAWNNDVLSIAKKVCVVSAHWYWYYRNTESAMRGFDKKMHSSYGEGIKILRSKLDMRKDEHYLLVCRRVLDSRAMLDRYSLNRMSFKDRKLRRSIFRHLCTEDPWTMIKEERFRRLASEKELKWAKQYNSYMPYILNDIKGMAKKLIKRR